MERVTSADGTAIAYERRELGSQAAGSVAGGPGGQSPVLCLHGTGVTRHVWRRFLDHAESGTFLVPDRRGRGESGDAESWSFEQEIEDVAALAAAETDTGPVTLFGSSFGGLLALRAAERIDVDRLALYEPPMPGATVEGREQGGLAVEVERRVRAGDREGAVRFFFEEATGATGVENWPIWPDCIDLAETIARECYVVESFDPAESSLSVPALLFRGTRSPDYLQDGIGVLETVLPETRVVDIEAGHAGVATAPGQIATAFGEFLASGTH
jgi:pimeloyl-ACP methyl ester carboxylesterase